MELDVPIVSIDYSLSPEAPYPRALEECMLAYCWILQNLEQLGEYQICYGNMYQCCISIFTAGTTGERIMFVGDSAGGNLVTTTSMKLKELGIRLPDAILTIYPSLNVTTSACPSRVMSLVDPVLPLGVMIACQQVRLRHCLVRSRCQKN